MGKVVTLIIGLVVGLIGGTMFGGALIGGAATGIGIATGLSAGICSTVQAAQEEGIMTPEQVDQVLMRAATDLADTSAEAGPGDIVGASADCEAVMQKLRDAASS